jgi:hypothetical protein
VQGALPEDLRAFWMAARVGHRLKEAKPDDARDKPAETIEAIH